MDNILSFVGFLFPPVIDMINRYVKSADLRFWVSVLFCVILGVGMSALTGNLTADAVARQALIFIGQAQISYKLWDKTTERKDLGLIGGSQAK